MKNKVVITKLPRSQAGPGLNLKAAPWSYFIGKMSEPALEVKSTLKPVPRDQSNLEAELGEVAMIPEAGGIPNTFKVGGSRHSNGGTPLNLPEDSFIFSDTPKLKIKDKKILAQFGIPETKAGVTPAAIAKKYDIGVYKKILLDKTTDKLQRETAEKMIANYNLKLAKLALIQESMKGFPQGLPQVAMPYIEQMQMDPSIFAQATPGNDSEVSQTGEADQMQYGGAMVPYSFSNRDLPSITDLYNQSANRYSNEIDDTFQKGGQTYSRGKKVFVYDQETGKYNVYKNGRLIGYYTGPDQKSTTPSGAATLSSKPTYKVNIPSTALTFSDPNDPNIKPEDVKAGKVYISTGGKWYKATGYQPKAATSKFTDPRILRPELNSSYGQLADMFNDPANEDLRKDLVANYRTKVAALKPTKNLTQADIDKMSALDDAGVIKNFLDHELQIFALHSAGIDGTKDTSGQWDKDRKVYQDAATKLGFTPSTPAETAAFQAAYKSLVDLSTDSKYKTKLQDFELKPIGKADEGPGGTSNISGIDGWFGNTTVGQAAKYRPLSQSLVSEEVQPDAEYPLVKESLQTPEVPDGSPWWLQDIMKTSQAASNYANIRQYEPWQATAPVVTPDVTFADPTRELAANAESVNEAVNTIAAYAGPQAFNSRFSELQGNAMKGAADILARYNNLNIGLSNQQSSQNAQLMNVANQQRATEQTNLWDKYQMTRQQFDNAKTQAKDAMVDAYTTGLTNKANTYNLNQMYPQFAIDPMSGGQMYFKNPRQFFPKNESDTPDVPSIFNRLLQETPSMSKHPEKVWDAALKIAGLSSKGTTFDDMAEMYKKAQGSTYPTQ